MTKEEAAQAGAHCHLCPLGGSKTAQPVPLAPLPRRVRLAIVGDNPHRTDERMGGPLLGMAGRLLDTTLSSAGLKRSECWVANVALCRGDSDKENERAAECCAPRLLGTLRALPLDTPIVTLGKAPTFAILGVRNLSVARGFVWETKAIATPALRSARRVAEKQKPGPRRDNALLKCATVEARAELAGRIVLPTLHPSFILRADTWAPILRIDIARAARLIASGGLPLADVGPYLVGGLELLTGMGMVVSLDVETDGIDPTQCKMLCVGISDGEKTVVIWPWRKAYARPLSKWLRTREAVVCHNLAYDELVMRSHGVC